MVCSPDDDKAEKQLKRDVMSVFDRRLDEREKRKKFIIEHNLTGLNEKPQKKKVASKKRPKVKKGEKLIPPALVRSCMSTLCGPS